MSDESLSSVSMMTDDAGALCCPRCELKLIISGGLSGWYKVVVDLSRDPNRKRNYQRVYMREYMRKQRARLKAEKAATPA